MRACCRHGSSVSAPTDRRGPAEPRDLGTPSDVTIRPAVAADADALTALAMRSKASWGYDTDMLDAFRDELTVTADYLAHQPAFLIEAHGCIAGFYSLQRIDDTMAELDFLFVDATHIGRGYGRALLDHAREQARDAGWRALLIQGDPHAEPFYLAAGARRAGSRESASIPGRKLPMFELRL